jgi:hypothetical protein
LPSFQPFYAFPVISAKELAEAAAATSEQAEDGAVAVEAPRAFTF